MRQFVLENQPVKNGLITLEGKDYKYLRQVLRVKVGDMLNVRMKTGDLQNTTVAKIDEKAKRLVLQICADTSEKTITRGVQATQIEGSVPKVEYWLFQFLPKPQKFEQIVRQATECGVSYIVPIIGEYTEKSSVSSIQGAKKERLERIVKEARQQSGSPVDIKVLEPMELEKAMEVWSSRQTELNSGAEENSEVLGFVLSERDEGEGGLRTLLQESKGLKAVGVAVGSEGGISPEEVKTLQEKSLFHPIHFAVNILRCETAALYGIAAVQTFVNEL